MARTTSSRLTRLAAPAALLLALGAGLAACGSSSSSTGTTTTSTTLASTDVKSQVDQLTQAAGTLKDQTFEATYTLDQGGNSSTVTFAQSPPKSLFKTSDTSFILDDGTNTYYCGADKKCVSSSQTSGLAGELGLFNGEVFSATARGYAVAASVLALLHVDVSFSNSTYAGQDSTCMTVTYTKGNNTTSTYCVATATGLLTYWSVDSTTYTLTSYTSSPPDSDFTVPADYTTVTIPSLP